MKVENTLYILRIYKKIVYKKILSFMYVSNIPKAMYNNFFLRYFCALFIICVHAESILRKVAFM